MEVVRFSEKQYSNIETLIKQNYNLLESISAKIITSVELVRAAEAVTKQQSHTDSIENTLYEHNDEEEVDADYLVYEDVKPVFVNTTPVKVTKTESNDGHKRKYCKEFDTLVDNFPMKTTGDIESVNKKLELDQEFKELFVSVVHKLCSFTYLHIFDFTDYLYTVLTIARQYSTTSTCFPETFHRPVTL